jgi:hypothetical protein
VKPSPPISTLPPITPNIPSIHNHDSHTSNADFDTTSVYFNAHDWPAPPPNRTLTLTLIRPLPTAPTATTAPPNSFNGSLSHEVRDSLIYLLFYNTRADDIVMYI